MEVHGHCDERFLPVQEAISRWKPARWMPAMR